MSSEAAAAAVGSGIDAVGQGLLQTQNQGFSGKAAIANRNWLYDMSNTSHQREVKDLIAAGLNPALSASGGQGAPMAAGSVAQSSTSTMPPVTKNILDSMRLSNEKKLLGKDLKKRDEEIKLLKHQQKGTSAKAQLDSANAGVAHQTVPLIMEQMQTERTKRGEQTARKSVLDQQKIQAEFRNIIDDAKSSLYKGKGKKLTPVIDRMTDFVGKLLGIHIVPGIPEGRPGSTLKPIKYK